MLKIDMIKERLKGYLDDKRYVHSLNVANTAVELAKLCQQQPIKFEIAGLLHDCAKCFTRNKSLYYVNKYKLELDSITMNLSALNHGPIGAVVAKHEFDIKDNDILNAIYYHTTGRENMSTLMKITYLADFIEPAREYPGVEQLRKIAFSGDLNGAVLKAFDNTIIYVVHNQKPLHPRTVYARNYLLEKQS
ncbi:MAG: bis(5'-nucleosyl)-tetraphosphatase (symmetrical) YqeK [Clostridia bacterium]|nr:bis(5'-nucleosyl)-tetraphosphatase (symmetrical) YqeK [Clostridia bacterium]